MPLYPTTLDHLIAAWTGNTEKDGESNNDEELNEEFNSVPSRVVVTIYMSLMHSLLFLESVNLCHSDIKPSNIFIDSNGRAILGDFGAVVNYGKPIKEWTTAYSLIDDDNETIASLNFDLFSCSIIILEMVIGKGLKVKKRKNIFGLTFDICKEKTNHIGISFIDFMLEKNVTMTNIIDKSNTIITDKGLGSYLPNFDD